MNITDPRTNRILVLAMFGLLAACGEPTTDDSTGTEQPPAQNQDDELPPLAPLDSVVGDHPEENGEVLERYDSKFDITLPARYDVTETLSPVRNQGRRGTCSIFSTVGLMEHLYIKAGMMDPDFSEQYLQWSSKVELGRFPNSGGSSGQANVDTIVRFGIPEEGAWPYESSRWGTDDDPSCTGDEQPTICYTNGNPSMEAASAPRYKLPRREYVSSYTDSLKTYIKKNERAVISGMTFFYQSWSHGGSGLEVNQDNRLAGAVVFPSEADQADSEESPAGHSILLVGWDDDKTFPRLAEDGTPLTDEDGNVVMDKGFFLFKNSWGTGSSWGSENEFGPGFGWLSYRYVQRWGRSVSAVEPETAGPVVEICGDGIDNDDNGVSDCADSACAQEMACQSTDEPTVLNQMPGAAIPDGDQDGYNETVTVDTDSAVTGVKVEVDISHSWRGDISILLTGPNGDVAILREGEGGSENDIQEVYTTDVFNGISAAGEWTLNVIDDTEIDSGTLNTWSLEITH